jgi:hypothetical protein
MAKPFRVSRFIRIGTVFVTALPRRGVQLHTNTLLTAGSASDADPVDDALGRSAGPEPNACHQQRVRTQREHRTPPEPDPRGTIMNEAASPAASSPGHGEEAAELWIWPWVWPLAVSAEPAVRRDPLQHSCSSATVPLETEEPRCGPA